MGATVDSSACTLRREQYNKWCDKADSQILWVPTEKQHEDQPALPFTAAVVHLTADDQNGESVTCLDVHTGVSVEELPAAQDELEESSGNCGGTAYSYCCGVGTPCDCSKGMASAGQCGSAAYGYCCMYGTKCDCDSPPLPFLNVV